MKESVMTLFVLRKGQCDKNGLSPIYLRITVNNKRAELSTNRKIEPKKWDSRLQRAKGRSETAKTLNNYLEKIENQVKQNFNKLLDKDEIVTASVLKDMLNGVHKEEHSFISVFEENNTLIKQEEGGKYSKSTINQYETTLSRLKIFLKREYNCDDIYLSKLNNAFIRRFENFLTTEYKIHHNTVMKHSKQLKKVIHYAIELEYIDHDPFLGYKTTYKNVSRTYLTEDELNRIETHVFRIKRLEQVKDVFLFVCYTGISYSDLKNLTKDNFSKGIDGKIWISFKRRKTNVHINFPLLPAAKKLIDKYKNNPECNSENKVLPVKSNQRLNSYLAEIAELCEINKKITMHIGRHTYATTVTLANGVSMESVSSMLGHTSVKTTQIYSKVVNSKVAKEMNDLEIALSKKGKSNEKEMYGENKIAQ